MPQTPLVTIGIPTYVGGPSLVKTVESLLQSDYASFRLIVSVDGKKLDPEIKAALVKDSRVEVIENEVRRGQVGGIRQILSLALSDDIVILAQDDLIFDRKSIGGIVASFHDPMVTMVTANADILPPTNWFERIMETGFEILKTVEREWNQGDNYLNASGRCIAFRKHMTKNIFQEIQEEVISCDAHFYFINRQYGGKFVRSEGTYWFRRPKTLADHLKQSKKYQNVAAELYKYRRIDAFREYAIPFSVKIRAAVKGLLHYPFRAPLYYAVLAYTRFHRDATFKKATRFWDTDASTKEL